jgi:hypothetical protein
MNQSNIDKTINSPLSKEQRAERVKALKAYYRDSNKFFDEWAKTGYQYPPPESSPFPEMCRDMKCEAKTRSGKPCKNDGTSWANGRCKFHGGASTGPVTIEGKKRVSMNAKKSKPLETS